MSELIGVGRVESLCINGQPVDSITFSLYGPQSDTHSGFSRHLSGHDGEYARTSTLRKGAVVFNWRSWTAVSREDLTEIERALGVPIPQGCLLENMVLTGIPFLSKLAPTSRLIFPNRDSQAILAVWEENSPCHVVGQRLADYYGMPELKKQLIAGAQNKRGVMGLVLSAGKIEVGDDVMVYSPV